MSGTLSARTALMNDLQRTRLSLAVTDAGWFTTENLFRAVDPVQADTLLLQCMDFANARNKRISPLRWVESTRQTGPATWERRHILPPGWMSRFPRWGMAPIARSIRNWHSERQPNPLALVLTYPQYLEISRQVDADVQLYYNVDDYRLYWPSKADQVEELEHRAVQESDLTVCVARHRAEELRAAVPEAAERILHIPHGAPREALAPEAIERPTAAPVDIAHLPRPLIGYVGSLEDRVDWSLLDAVARAFPGGSLVLVGRVVEGTGQEWQAKRRSCLDRPNVHAIGWRAQSEIHRYNRSFDLTLIPYDAQHPFNIACSPTKIMDSLASARPIVSTALPECRLYEDLMHVAETKQEFLEAIASLLDQQCDDGRGQARLDWATDHTCEKTVGILLEQLALVRGWN